MTVNRGNFSPLRAVATANQSCSRLTPTTTITAFRKTSVGHFTASTKDMFACSGRRSTGRHCAEVTEMPTTNLFAFDAHEGLTELSQEICLLQHICCCVHLQGDSIHSSSLFPSSSFSFHLGSSSSFVVLVVCAVPFLLKS